MSLKFLILLVGLLAISAVEARSFLKKIHDKETSFSFALKAGQKASTHFRERRDIEDDKEEVDSTSINSEEVEAFLKLFMAVAWEEDKHGMLTTFLELMSDSDTNITVIGWQKIVGENGKVEEIRSLQVVIPQKPESETTNIVEEDEDDDWLDKYGNERNLPYQDITEMREIFSPMEKAGVPVSVTYEEFEENGKLSALMYLDKDELYVNTEGLSIVNKTITATPQEISDFIAQLKPTTLGKPSVLKYDVDGNFVPEHSHVKPYLLGSVVDEYDAPANILTASPQIISEIAVQHPKESIAKHLGVEFNKQFPEYKWRVLVNPTEYHITRDVSVTLTFDNFDLDEESYIDWLVYGVKKEK